MIKGVTAEDINAYFNQRIAETKETQMSATIAEEKESLNGELNDLEKLKSEFGNYSTTQLRSAVAKTEATIAAENYHGALTNSNTVSPQVIMPNTPEEMRASVIVACALGRQLGYIMAARLFEHSLDAETDSYYKHIFK